MIEVKHTTKDTYIFELKSESGHTLLKSIPFINEQDVRKVVRNLIFFTTKENTFERKTNHKGQFLFNMQNETGKLIATSPTYNSEAGMESGIKNLTKRIAVISKLQDL